MKAPYWLTRWVHRNWQRKGLLSTLLLPLSWIVGLVGWFERRRFNRPIAMSGYPPILIVGNLVVGGTGKTPVVIAVAQALKAMGWHPGIISRGYGAHLNDSARTGSGSLDPDQFGDEPALIAQATNLPISVHPKRLKALQTLLDDFPDVDVVLSDDGLQHLALPRNIEIIVQDARGIGNGRLLPAGPLRERAARLKSADYLITNLGTGQLPPSLPFPAQPARMVEMRLAPTTVTHLATGRTLPWEEWLHVHGAAGTLDAVAAIGQPDRFFSMLLSHGLTLGAAVALPDHDAYAESPFRRLTSSVILITAKDAVKCARFHDERLWVVNVSPVFSDPGWLDELQASLEAIAAKKAAAGSTLGSSN